MTRQPLLPPRPALALTAAFALAIATPASAQMLQQPWTFSQTNRASIAFSLRSANGGQAGAAALAGTSILCGGGSSTAAGNSTCIVLNNADGTIVLDQVSDGSQDAKNAQASDASTITEAATTSGSDEVLSILEGGQ